jgi:hypothetical protein
LVWKKTAKILPLSHFKEPYQVLEVKLVYGVTGNTSDFGSEESRFEPW